MTEANNIDLLNRVAQDIASTASNITNYYIVITDENGVIIGTSTDYEDRLGTVHEGSLLVIHSGKARTHNEEDCKTLKGTYPGITLPICIHDDVVGTIGIKGNSLEVKKYGLLVKMLAEVMIKDRLESESAHIRWQNTQMLVNMVATFSKNIDSETTINNCAMLLGLDLYLPRVAILLNIDEKSKKAISQINSNMYETQAYRYIRNIFNGEQDIIAAPDKQRYLIFARVNDKGNTTSDIKEKCQTMAEQFPSTCSVCMGIGSRCHDIISMEESFLEAQKSLVIAMDGKKDKIVQISDIPLETIIIEIEENIEQEIWMNNITSILDSKNCNDIMDLVINWCETKFNLAETARRMVIHKNTLAYRFTKIKEQYGIDLYDFNKTIAIYLSIRAYMLSKDNR